VRDLIPSLFPGSGQTGGTGVKSDVVVQLPGETAVLEYRIKPFCRATGMLEAFCGGGGVALLECSDTPAAKQPN
jgi:hypothetical protein